LLPAQLAAADRDLLGVRAGQGQRRPLRVDLLRETLDVRLGGRIRRARLIVNLPRHDVLFQQRLGALEVQPRALEVRSRLRLLRLGRGQRRFRLPDLVAGLQFLVLERRLGFLDACRVAFFGMRVVGLVCLQLLWLNRGQQLVALDGIALLDHELAQAPLYLRADVDFVRGHDAREDEAARAGAPGPVECAAGHGEGAQDQQHNSAHHGSDASGSVARVYRVRAFSWWRSRASSTSRSMSFAYGSPVASHSLGYMLIGVKPGMVLISFTKSPPVRRSRRKSTRAMPAQSTASKARIASCWTRLTSRGRSLAGIISSEPSLRYLAS